VAAAVADDQIPSAALSAYQPAYRSAAGAAPLWAYRSALVLVMGLACDARSAAAVWVCVWRSAWAPVWA
jgi:hypothetical protein